MIVTLHEETIEYLKKQSSYIGGSVYPVKHYLFIINIEMKSNSIFAIETYEGIVEEIITLLKL